MPEPRDYGAEYARRVRLAAEQQESRSKARGHNVPPEGYDRQLEQGLKAIRDGMSLTAAAESIGVAPERLRGYLQQTGVASKQKERWSVGEDHRSRVVPVFSRGRTLEVTVSGYEEARLIGQYMSAVGQFLRTNDVSLLEPFRGKGLHDVNGVLIPFETNPNALYRLNRPGEDPFEAVYRINA